MEERIVVPLDGSEAGEAILPKLDDLIFKTTPRMDAKITLLKVISKVNFNVLTTDEKAQLPISDEDAAAMTAEATSYLEKIAAGLRKKGAAVNTVVTFGHTAEEIVKVARETKAHLIAMSGHSRPGYIRWAIGSVTDKVMRLEGDIPVLAVKPGDKHQATTVQPLESLKGMTKRI
jgi:nucleotide-binding universal stress UspA family protein